MKKEQKIGLVDTERHTALSETARSELKAQLRNRCLDLLAGYLNQMFENLDDEFFDLANKAHTNNEQNRLFDAMREIRIKRKGIENFIQQSVAEAFDAPVDIATIEHSRPVDDEPDELSLVKEEALEEDVAIESMVTRTRASFTGSLLQFQARASNLYRGQGLKAGHSAATSDQHTETVVNPLDPSIFGKAIREVFQGIDIGLKEKLIAFKHFERAVMLRLIDLLEEGNGLLVQAGILPNLKYTARKSPGQAPHPTHHTALSEENFPPEEDVFSQAQGLLASLREGSQPGLPPIHEQAVSNEFTASRAQGAFSNVQPLRAGESYQGPTEIVESRQLVSLLSDIQKALQATGNSTSQPEEVQIRSAVQGALKQQAEASEKPTALSQVDEDLINLVSMLFEFILDDYNLSAPVQVMISRLQIPILKVALRDKSFFSKPSHPARKLLNGLAKASIGWGNSTEQSKDRLFKEIHEIVDLILEETHADTAFFESLHERFSRFNEQEEKRFRLVEQRTKEAEVGKAKSQKARLVVDRILYEKISVTALPQIALDILKSGWSRVMFLVYLREGRGHRFSQCVKVVDELVWCLQPHTDEEDRKRWVQVVPKLLKNLKIGLKEVSYNTERLDIMLLDLKKELTQIFKRQSVSAALKDAPTPAPLKELKASIDAAEQHNKVVYDASLGEYLDKIDALEPGAWVEFELVNGTSFRCKLATRLEETDCLVFVNRMGLKVVEKSRVELAEELHKGQLIILDSGLLMDRAITTVMQNLRKMSGKVA